MRDELRAWVAQTLKRPIENAAPLLAEASHRQFHRVQAGGRSFVVMDSPPALERNDAFVAMQALFRDGGLPVPDIVAKDRNRGFFLLSDLGARHLQDVYGGPDQESALELAIRHLVRLQGIAAVSVPPYAASRFQDELHIFVEWFLGRLLGEAPHPVLDSAFAMLVDNALTQPQCLIHRDYHCRNLLLDRGNRFGILDFQDALVGPATYDLACLLWDCYHRFDEGQRRRWRERYRAQCQFAFGSEALRRMLDLTALQRQFKAVGIFARLWLRQGKTSHLGHIAPVLEDMQHISAQYPQTQDLTSWLKALARQAAPVIGAAS